MEGCLTEGDGVKVSKSGVPQSELFGLMVREKAKVRAGAQASSIQ